MNGIFEIMRALLYYWFGFWVGYRIAKNKRIFPRITWEDKRTLPMPNPTIQDRRREETEHLINSITDSLIAYNPEVQLQISDFLIALAKIDEEARAGKEK